jgi:hypothetical protein
MCAQDQRLHRRPSFQEDPNSAPPEVATTVTGKQPRVGFLDVRTSLPIGGPEFSPRQMRRNVQRQLQLLKARISAIPQAGWRTTRGYRGTQTETLVHVREF